MSNLNSTHPPYPPYLTNPPPPSKRRKLSLPPGTNYARNAGSATSFLPLSTIPAFANDDSGSDTEEEDNSKLEQFFLNQMTDDTDRKRETVFGDGVRVWRSVGGTVYADLEEGVKRKMRGEEIWGVRVGGKRKLDDIEKGERREKKDNGGGDGEGVVKFPDLPPIPSISEYPPPLPLLPLPPTTPQPQLTTFRPRTPHDTLFNRGSANVDPLGAYNRPIKPLPTSSRRGRATENLPAPPNHIVSGSFGSFEGHRPSRFDERAYRLLPGRVGMAGKEKDGEGREKGKQEGEGMGKGKDHGGMKLDPFKGKPWLRRG